ncbi:MULTISPECIES: hypothetical protein [Lactobacillus]|uniref:Uncharacterized protein n=1 Tax=Lactobacillus xujianguonis TaxID=2495899 RepID=A0A437SUT6_9LACO|nr:MULTISPECIES: hypothetical protein [Lactobacillus]RVU70674.1 hypothetical protein EJK17_06005 [Lactobacillus xujianguonis]RVU77153.1 hypothetical protein EJK20_02355 [Lactobacillus xujianguonis]
MDLYDTLVGENTQSIFYLYAQADYSAASRQLATLSNLLLDELYNCDPILRLTQKDWLTWNQLDYRLKVQTLAKWNLVDAGMQEKLLNEGRSDLYTERGVARKIVDFYHLLRSFTRRYDPDALPVRKTGNFFKNKKLTAELVQSDWQLPQENQQDYEQLLAQFQTVHYQNRWHFFWPEYLSALVIFLLLAWLIQIPIHYQILGVLAEVIVMGIDSGYQWYRQRQIGKQQRALKQQQQKLVTDYQALTKQKEKILQEINGQQYPYPFYPHGLQKFQLEKTNNGPIVVRRLYQWQVLREQLVYDETRRLMRRDEFSSVAPIRLMIDKQQQRFLLLAGEKIPVADYQAS